MNKRRSHRKLLRDDIRYTTEKRDDQSDQALHRVSRQAGLQSAGEIRPDGVDFDLQNLDQDVSEDKQTDVLVQYFAGGNKDLFLDEMS